MQDVPKLTYGRLLNDMLFTIQWAKAGKLELKGQDFARNTWKQNTHVCISYIQGSDSHQLFIIYRLLTYMKVDSKCVLQEPQLSSTEKFDISTKLFLI